jgi:hypothetical protein
MIIQLFCIFFSFCSSFFLMPQVFAEGGSRLEQQNTESINSRIVKAIENSAYKSSHSPNLSISNTGYIAQDPGEAVSKKDQIRSSDGRFVDNDDGTITDTKTGLVWTKKDSWADFGKCFDWNDSRSYVNRLKTGGHSDWRLPTVDELRTIYESSKSNKDKDGDIIRIDPIFASGGAYWYWSSEESGICCARYVVFDGGHVDDCVRDGCGYGGVRAVRNQH